jgi:hypothetical protein
MWELIAGDPLMQFGLIVAGLGVLIAVVGRWLFRKWGPSSKPSWFPKEAGGGKADGGPRLPLEAGPSAPTGGPEVKEEYRRPRARLEVGPSGSILYLPDGRRVNLDHRDYRALGEAGRYLLPGTALLVLGLSQDEPARTSAHLLEVMGLQVVFEGSGDSRGEEG